MLRIVPILCIATILCDAYIGKVLYEEWFSRCEYPIQYVMTACLIAGVPVTFFVEAVRVNSSFRFAFMVELFLTIVSLGLLMVCTKWIMQATAETTCVYTAPRLWKILLVIVCFSWTAILIGATVMIVATSLVLLYSPNKSAFGVDSVGINKPPPKFKTYYGTL